MPESSLPRHDPEDLRASTLDLACRLDPIIARIEDEQGYADIAISVKRGIPRLLTVSRSYRLDPTLSAAELAERIRAIIAHIEDEAGYAQLGISVKRGLSEMLCVERSFKLS